MKGRARPPSSPESEESWTVDCPCGVNFDDGEEMVDCDECGVWVHTSCCHILKGHTSYVCDNCKFKKKKESEESEVAQLLVELPSKTPPLEEKVFSLRTELSIEERAHVQGIPGGDPAFFVGVSPVFSRELWKYSGYVPKVFQFSYKELPEWSDEKVGASILFGDGAEKKLDSPVLEFMRREHQAEEGKLLDAYTQLSMDVQADKHHLSKEKHSKRELRKESKHRHKLQQEDNSKGHHHSKRRRDESRKKDTTNKKRSKNAMVDNHYEGARKALGEVVVSLKSSRTAPKNPKAMRKLAVQNFMDDVDADTRTVTNNVSKVDVLGECGSDCLGFTRGEARFVTESLLGLEHLPLENSKTEHRGALVVSSHDEREGSNVQGMADNIIHHEAHFYQREQEGFARPKVVVTEVNLSVDRDDVLKSKEQLSDGGNTDVKSMVGGYSHSALGDPKEALHRVRSNIHVSSKDHFEETTDEQSDPNSGNEKEHLPTSFQQYSQGSSVQPGKHHKGEEVTAPSRQQSVLQKEAEMLGLGMAKQPEQIHVRAAKSTYGMHDLLANASEDEHAGSESVRLTDEPYAEDLLHFSTDRSDEQFLQDEVLKVKCQELLVLTPSSPVHQALLQEATAASGVATSVSAGAVGHSYLMVDDSIKSSPLSAQTGPSKSPDLSSPTFSAPGIDSKQNRFTQVDSVSPCEKTPNVGLAQPAPSSKAPMGSSAISNNKVFTSSMSKGENPPTSSYGKGHSSSKHRSRTLDMKKADVANVTGTVMSEGLNEMSSCKDSQELVKTSETKVVGSGKGLAAVGRVVLNSKAQASHTPAAKHPGQLPSKQDSEQSLPQSRHSVRLVSTSMPHKAEKSGMVSGSKNVTVLSSPHHASTLDRHLPGTGVTPPVLNDEELALLLHQELNSSPRVARVTRVRQSGIGPHPLSAKRPAIVSTPVASISSQKDHHLIFRRKNRDESLGEVSHADDDAPKAEALRGATKQDGSSLLHVGSRKDKDTTDACMAQKPSLSMTAAEISRHLSPGPGIAPEGQSHSDVSGANDPNDGERRSSADNILTLPGLIEEILNEKGHIASYDYICEEVLPHWPKLRKHNGERYAYTSHRQAVLDCLRNRSAWSHLIDRGPKTNLGRKRRRPESVLATELENAEQAALFHDDDQEDHSYGKASKEAEVDGSESWPLSDSNKDADLTLPEEVPKGKRKARRGRRLAVQSKGYGARAHHGRDARIGELAAGVADDLERVFSPSSEDAASTYSEEEEILVHRGSGRHISRCQGSSVDSEEDDIDL